MAKSAYKKRTEERRKKGVCTICGERRPTGGFVICEPCRRHMRESAARRRAGLSNSRTKLSSLASPDGIPDPPLNYCPVCGTNVSGIRIGKRR